MNSRRWTIRGSVILLALGAVLASRAASADDAAGTGSKLLDDSPEGRQKNRRVEIIVKKT
jgi:flagellar motor protein MotB